AQLHRKEESESANLAAWQAWRAHHEARDPAEPPGLTGTGSSSVDLAALATARPLEDWVPEDEQGADNNHFVGLHSFSNGGIDFHCGEFILLAGKTLRLSAGKMLPRSTGWIPLNSASRRVACIVAACNVFKPAAHSDTCCGSIFLLRKNG